MKLPTDLTLTRLQALMQRINQREKHKEALADRRSAAAQARMKSIATLAADERVPKRGRKVGGGKLAILHLLHTNGS